MCAISVQLDGVAALAAELTALAMELRDDADLCRRTAGPLSAALDGDEGWTAGATSTAWGSLTGVVSARAAAVATTLAGAVAAYRAADAALAAGLGAAVPAPGTGPR